MIKNYWNANFYYRKLTRTFQVLEKWKLIFKNFQGSLATLFINQTTNQKSMSNSHYWNTRKSMQKCCKSRFNKPDWLSKTSPFSTETWFQQRQATDEENSREHKQTYDHQSIVSPSSQTADHPPLSTQQTHSFSSINDMINYLWLRTRKNF